MASSNVEMASTSKANTDLPRESSVCSISTIISDLHHSADSSRNLVSMSMDDLLKNIYSDTQNHNEIEQVQHHHNNNINNSKIGNDVWNEIVAGNDQRREDDSDQEITLEDFLTKAGAVREEDVRVSEAGGYGVDGSINSRFQMEGSMVGFDGRLVGRGKRRAVEEPVDKATQQKQRRMIKNRESAARSRERKQAYTIELESLVMQLEEEKARLLREEAEHIKERSKQLKEKLIPVVEKRRPQRILRRVHSLQW